MSEETAATLRTVRRQVERAPTIMDADTEIAYFEALMKLPAAEVVDGASSWGNFLGILDRLSESHTQVFFEVGAHNIDHFCRFADWLADIADLLVPDLRSGLLEVADTFRIDPREVFD